MVVVRARTVLARMARVRSMQAQTAQAQMVQARASSGPGHRCLVQQMGLAQAPKMRHKSPRRLGLAQMRQARRERHRSRLGLARLRQ